MHISKVLLLVIFAMLSGCVLLPPSIEEMDKGDRYMNALNKDERVQHLLKGQPRNFLRGGFDGYGIGILHTGNVLGVRENGEVIQDDHLTDAQVEVLGAIAVNIARKMHFPKRIVIKDNDLAGFHHGRTRVFHP